MKNEAMIRLGVFTSVLILMAIWESLAPRRICVVRRWRHSLNNLMLSILDSLLVRLIPSLSAVAAAKWATMHHIGLLNWFQAPWWLKGIVALLVLDLLIYCQHVATHRLAILWRFHRVHHADLDLDATSGLRFHPVEILLSMGVKVVAVVLLGAAAETVMLFEIGLNGAAIFNHGNVFIPMWCDRVLRWFIVTPDMHRVHHSIRSEETHSNFGFNLPWWDWLFQTYRAQPHDSHRDLTLGLPDLRHESETVPLAVMLWIPFRSSNVQLPAHNSQSSTSPSETNTGSEV